MSKHIWTHSAKQSADRTTAEATMSMLGALVSAWNGLGIGEFNEDLLNGNRSKYQSGCSSCQGIRNYSQGEKLIQDYLLDQAGSVSVGGGLKLSRERLRDVLELPDPKKVEAFEQPFQRYRRDQFGRFQSPFVKIENGQVILLEEELEQHLKTYERHISNPVDMQLLEDLEAFVALTGSLNARLQKRNMQVIELNYSVATGQFAIVKVHDNKPYVDKELLSSYLK